MLLLFNFISLLCLQYVHDNNIKNMPQEQVSSTLRADCKPLVCGANFLNMEHYKNYSLENITEEVDGVTHTETWVDVKGFEIAYQVSSFGRIKSKKRFIKTRWGTYTKEIPELIRVQKITRNGYLAISFTQDQKKHWISLHRLTALHFIEGNSALQINHIKGNKKDNRCFMLEWTTALRNHEHAIETGLKNNPVGETNSNAKLTADNVREVRVMAAQGIRSGIIAEKFGVKPNTITEIKNGRKWSHLQ